MKSRLELQTLLEELLESKQVYFQAPESVKMKYPAIVYNIEDMFPRYADDKTYLLYNKYQITFMTKDPDDPKIKEIAGLQQCRFNRSYVSDHINHYIYNIYF